MIYYGYDSVRIRRVFRLRVEEFLVSGGSKVAYDWQIKIENPLRFQSW